MKIDLPCGVGTKVYCLTKGFPQKIYCYKVKGFKITGKYKVLPLVDYDTPVEIGVDGFFSKEEAEKRVKEIRAEKRQ